MKTQQSFTQSYSPAVGADPISLGYVDPGEEERGAGTIVDAVMEIQIQSLDAAMCVLRHWFHDVDTETSSIPSGRSS